MGDKTDRIAGAYARLFKTDDGKVVLQDLEDTFVNRKLFGTDAHMTTGRAAQKDVIWHIQRVINSTGGTNVKREPGRK